MALTEKAALKALPPVRGDGEWKVTPHKLDGFWFGNVVDGNGRGKLGSRTIIGPDGSVFQFSSNPGLHNFIVVDEVLEEAYEDEDPKIDPKAIVTEVQRRTVARRSGPKQGYKRS